MNLLIAMCSRPGVDRTQVVGALIGVFGGMSISLNSINADRGITVKSPPKAEWMKTYIEAEKRLKSMADSAGSVVIVDWSNFHVGHRRRWAKVAYEIRRSYLTIYVRGEASSIDGLHGNWAGRLFEAPLGDEPNVEVDPVPIMDPDMSGRIVRAARFGGTW